MSKVRVAAFSTSIDGYGAGPEQSLDDPLGKRGEELHEWFIPTRTFQGLYGSGEGTTGIDEKFATRSMENLGAWIMGRNMFGPVRGGSDESWKGWWGDNPPYHVPVFVLTHHPRDPIRQYLQARLIDEMHVAIAPILLGRGESLFEGLDLPKLGYVVTEHVASEAATHVVITRKD